MIAKLLRRAALFSGIFLLSMSVVGLSVFAAPPKAAPPGGHLNVTEVLVDDPDNPTSITIIGEDFDFGPGPLVVTLGEFGLLTIDSATGTEIVATLPANIPGGDFLLTVSTGNGQSQNDEYDLTIGAGGPQGPKGDPGAPGAPGADGADGAPGSIDLSKIVRVVSNNTRLVPCPTDHVILGGGVECALSHPIIIISEPDQTQNANGWSGLCINTSGTQSNAARVTAICIAP